MILVRCMWRVFGASALAASWIQPAFAAEDRPFAAPQAAELPATGTGSFVQVTIALGIVLAAVFAAAWLMQRLRGFTGANAGAIRIVSSVSLGTKERAVLVQLGNEQVLLGVASGQVSRLHVLSQPILSQPSASLPPDTAQGQPMSQAPTFKAVLRRSLGLS